MGSFMVAVGALLSALVSKRTGGASIKWSPNVKPDVFPLLDVVWPVDVESSRTPSL